MCLLGQKVLQGGQVFALLPPFPPELWLGSGGMQGAAILSSSWMSNNGNLLPWCDWGDWICARSRQGKVRALPAGIPGCLVPLCLLPLGLGWRATFNENRED